MNYLALILACTSGVAVENCHQIIAINIASASRIECVVNARSYVQSAIFNAGEYVKVICTPAGRERDGSLYIEPMP